MAGVFPFSFGDDDPPLLLLAGGRCSTDQKQEASSNIVHVDTRPNAPGSRPRFLAFIRQYNTKTLSQLGSMFFRHVLVPSGQ